MATNLKEGVKMRQISVAIMGFGNVGQKLSHLAQAFDMKVYAYDPHVAESNSATTL